MPSPALTSPPRKLTPCAVWFCVSSARGSEGAGEGLGVLLLQGLEREFPFPCLEVDNVLTEDGVNELIQTQPVILRNLGQVGVKVCGELGGVVHLVFACRFGAVLGCIVGCVWHLFLYPFYAQNARISQSL